MTERVWLDGALPAVATDTWAVMSAGRGAIPAARRILALPPDTAGPSALLDALLTDGLAATPAFALVALERDRLTAFLRGPFELRAEHVDGTIERVDGHGVHSWREVSMSGIRRAWCLQSPAITRTDSALRALPARPGPTTASGVAMRATVAVTPGPTVALTPPRPTPPRDATPRMIELPDGERVTIEGDLLIGRGPRSDRLDGRALPVLIALDKAPREVSRRHVRISRHSSGDVRIEDLGSAGGTTLVDIAGAVRRLRPAEPAPVAVGETAELPGGVRIRFVGDA